MAPGQGPPETPADVVHVHERETPSGFVSMEVVVITKHVESIPKVLRCNFCHYVYFSRLVISTNSTMVDVIHSNALFYLAPAHRPSLARVVPDHLRTA